MADQTPAEGQSPAPTEPAAAATPMQLDDMLTAEFAYISQVVFQSNEDRARVTSFYLITTGTLVAAILGSQVESLKDPETYRGFAVLFLILSLSSLLTLLQLIRLRQAWFDGVAALNALKSFYIERFPDAKKAFRWSADSLPTKYKPWSISFLLALQVALLGGISLGGAVIFFGLITNFLWWGAAIIVGIAYSTFEMFLYRYLLRR
jgi:hypothetical protein